MTLVTEGTVSPPYGYLEYAVERDGVVTLAGWMLALDGPFDRFEARGPSSATIRAETKMRPDLRSGLPQVPGAERGGFLVMVPLPADFGPSSVLEFELVGLRGGRQVAAMPICYHRPERTVLPPEDVRHRATGNPVEFFYFATGINDCHDILRALRPHVDSTAVRDLLDWGCGAGRLTRHLIERLPAVNIHGTDIDTEAVEWAAANLRGTFVPCGKEPPLPYRDGQFDVIVSLSVFTHLLERYQTIWLAELQRILAPGGTLLVTTHGKHAGGLLFHDPKVFAEVFRTGFHDGTGSSMLQHVADQDYYRGTYQTYEWTKPWFERYFEVLSYTEAGKSCFQDIWVMRKR